MRCSPAAAERSFGVMPRSACLLALLAAMCGVALPFEGARHADGGHVPSPQRSGMCALCCACSHAQVMTMTGVPSSDAWVAAGSVIEIETDLANMCRRKARSRLAQSNPGMCAYNASAQAPERRRRARCQVAAAADARGDHSRRRPSAQRSCGNASFLQSVAPDGRCRVRAARAALRFALPPRARRRKARPRTQAHRTQGWTASRGERSSTGSS